MTVAQKSYDIQPGQDVDDNADFIPLSVLVDNYSPYWLLLPDAGRYVPPYTAGSVFPLIHATTNRAHWSSPPVSSLQAPSTYIDTAGFAHLTYVAETLAYVAGSIVPNSVLSQQASFSVSEGGTLTETLTFLAQGVRIDNPGGTAYTIVGTNLVIPPWTTAWVANFTTPFNTITIQPIANPNGTPNTTAGGPLVATFYAQQLTTSGGTPYTQPTTTAKFSQSVKNTSVSPSVALNLPSPAVAGDLIVAAIGWDRTSVTSPTGCGITGFTQLVFTAGSNGSFGYWIGYKVAAGGEQNLTATIVGAGTSNIGGMVGVYTGNANGLAQTNITAASNSSSVTPISAPNLLVCIDFFGSTSVGPGTVSSTNLKINDSFVFNFTTRQLGIAIGSLLYQTSASETGTLTWSGGTAAQTAVFAAE